MLSPIYGTPAYRAGMQAGDLIVEIDGNSTDGLQIEDAIRLMKGPDGTKVSITIVHAGQTKREKFTLDRERVRVETVLGDRRKHDDHWDFMYDDEKLDRLHPHLRLQPRYGQGTPRGDAGIEEANSAAWSSICVLIPAGCSARRSRSASSTLPKDAS